jgi:hypothetical protein
MRSKRVRYRYLGIIVLVDILEYVHARAFTSDNFGIVFARLLYLQPTSYEEENV